MDVTSAAGPDGMNVLHLRILIRSGHHKKPNLSGEAKISSFTQVFADDRIFPPVAELFASATEVGIYKPPKGEETPGIRPIASGIVFRRLVFIPFSVSP